MVGAVKRFCSLAKQRMGAWLGEDHGGCGASARDLVHDNRLLASTVICCPRIFEAGAEDRLLAETRAGAHKITNKTSTRKLGR